MTKKPTLIVANWKMNLNIQEASMLVHKLDDLITTRRDVEVILAPGMLTLQSVDLQINHRKFKLATQNLYWRDEGPYTGEVSANQLRGLVKYAIIGHSERRNIFHEHGRDIGRKMQAAVRNQIRPILCVGESAGERANNETNDVIYDQLVSGLSNLTADDMEQVVIAYEPIWAISSGTDFATKRTPTPSEVRQVHTMIRRHVAHLFGKKAAVDMQVLYGGSVNSDNAAGYVEVDGIDGFLVGGASLLPDQFASICDTAYKFSKETSGK